MSKNVEIFLLTNQKYGSIIRLHFHIFYNLIQNNFLNRKNNPKLKIE